MLKSTDLLGKVILVGITIENPNGEKEYVQTHGTGERIEGDYIVLRREDNTEFYLGVSPQAFSAAKPGVYTEKSTGIQIENPDYISQWVLSRPSMEGAGTAKANLLRDGFRGFIKEMYRPLT